MNKSYTVHFERTGYDGVGGEHYWNIFHRNGREICRSSETYKRLSDCKRGLLRMLEKLKLDDYEVV